MISRSTYRSAMAGSLATYYAYPFSGELIAIAKRIEEEREAVLQREKHS
jgi:hypothetical protein